MASSFQTKDLSSRIQRSFQQPTTLSALASIGVHLVIFALLPVLPGTILDESEPEIRRPVDMVELTPEEQSRLPDFSTPPIDLPPLLDSLPPSVANLPPLPSFSNPPQSSSLPSLDDLLSDPFLQQSPSIPVPIYPTTPPPPSAPSIRIQPLPPRPVTPPPTETAPEEAPATPRRRGEVIPEDDQQVATNSETAEPVEEPSPEVEPPPQARSNEEVTAALLAEVQERQRQIVLQQQLTYDQTNTDQDPGYNPGSNWVSWVEQSAAQWGVDLSSVDPTSNKFPEASMEAAFPPEACELIQETLSADYGVIVDANGSPIGGLALLRSSGYEYFNNLGGNAVLNSSFENATGANTPLLVTVTFPYNGNACTPAEDSTASTPAG